MLDFILVFLSFLILRYALTLRFAWVGLRMLCTLDPTSHREIFLWDFIVLCVFIDFDNYIRWHKAGSDILEKSGGTMYNTVPSPVA